MTDTSRLNRLLEQTRGRAGDEVAPLAAMYETALKQIARDASTTFVALTASTWQPQPEGNILRALEVVAASIAATQERIYTRILRAVVSEPMTRLGIAWDVTHPLSRQLLARAGRRTGERLGLAVQPLLRETVGAAYEKGLSVPETAAAVRATLTEAAPWQAEMLARTDLNSLANGGSVIAAKLAGASYKTWEATLDDRTRPDHADAHGQTVPVDQPFQVGGEPLDYPGDPFGSDEMTINCRCTVTYGDALTAAASPTLSGGTMATTSTLRTIAISGVAAIEGSITRDNSPMPRVLLARSLAWEEMPVPFMANIRTSEGHEGAEVAGRIDSFRRRRGADGEWQIAFTGELTTPFGIDEIAPMIADGTLTGVSADLGATTWAVVDRETLAEIPEEEIDVEAMAEGKYLIGLTGGQILAVTLCPTQALAGARVGLVASANRKAVTMIDTDITLEQPAALVAAAAPAAPPREWFDTPEPPGKMPLTITDDGRVFGHIADWETCHTGFANQCVTPPRSPSGYSYFHVAELELADGDKIAVGKLMLASKGGGKHATINASREEAGRHYDDTSMVAAYLCATDGRYGIWVAGALNPRLSADRVRELRTLPPSGDWREVNGRLELIAALAVPVPGFPIPRAEVALVASADEVRVTALVASSGQFEVEPAVVRALAAAGLVIDDEQETEARTRALLARAEGGIDGLVELATQGGNQ